MFCTKCGEQIEDDAIYCNYCGTKVDIEEKVEEKVEEQVEEQVEEISKLSKISVQLCILLLAIGLITSIANAIKFAMLGRDINYVFGQIIFGVVFAVSINWLKDSKKIGVSVLIPFILFKMIISIYYYFVIPYRYFIKNLIIDEIFYLAIIFLSIISWKNLK